MKRIILKLDGPSNGLKPTTYTVDFETETYIIVLCKAMRGCEPRPMRLDKQADGSFKNENNVRFLKVTADRRPKPFSVESQEEGRGPKTITKFATTEELTEYVKGRWQGWDYYDGDNTFHNDYARFTVKGANLADLVPRDGEGLVQRCSELEREVAAENGYSDWELSNELEG